MSVVSNADAASKEALDNIQAHLLRASKYEFMDGDKKVVKTRNWSLFFFFRILPQAEFDGTIQRLKAATETSSDADDSADKISNERDLWLDFAQPSFANAGIVEQRLADVAPAVAPPRPPDAPAQAFLDWLKVLASADKSALLSNLTRWITPTTQLKGASAPTPEFKGFNIADLNDWVAERYGKGQLSLEKLSQWLQIYADSKNYELLLQEMGRSLQALIGGDSPSLAIVALYELLRQGALAMANDSNQEKPGLIRGEAKDPDKISADTTPINIAFTYSGLEALKLDKVTLASFPDPFKQGMAARAQRLHDTGPSAPENWEGELGLPSIHGYFTGGFAAADKLPRDESFWKAMRSDVAAFNNPVDKRGNLLRFWLRLIFRALGLEILHIELGQDPYHVVGGQIVSTAERMEHFGFRDGLSQPFVDLGLADTSPGGGTASRNGTWTPIAPGEIFLSLPDEDNEVQRVPISRELTKGSTFLVFRKLEQDVAGFQAFLRHHRSTRQERDALAAQMVGRWQDGTPLVLSPGLPRAQNLDASLNNFRYAADDPYGEKCPLQAHIRRANPRDIGGRDEVQRHRILRRGISYGGPLLEEEAVGDDEKRGLLFIAANSRIDLQFEVIQADWINRGEFLGQAGLGRCPLTGAHDGAVSDSFLEANAIAPMTRMPRFVITRGGDYFFAPGIEAIKLISQDIHFEPQPDEIPFGGFTMADASTPVLFERDRLQRYSAQILASPTAAVVRVPLPPSPPGAQQHISFVGRHAHVTTVLRNDDGEGLAFSVKQYRDAARFMTRGQDMLVAVDTGPTRVRLKAILNEAWTALRRGYQDDSQSVEDVLRNVVRKALEMAIRRTAQARRIDLVHDLASRATYALLCELYGTPGPNWLTELAASLPFAHQHVGELPPDWLASLTGDRPDDQGLATMQVWSTIILADLVGNIQSQTALHVIARQAATEMLNHIDALLALRLRALADNPVDKPKTLLEAFVKISHDMIAAHYGPLGADAAAAYFKDVSVLLLEIAGTSLAAIPLTLASAMHSLFKFRIDLPSVLPQILRKPDGVARLVYEAERLNPNLAVRMRYCERTTTLSQGTTINKGDWVGALIVAANLDSDAFKRPHLISFDPAIRDIKKYLLFNEGGAERECWGRNRVAMAVLEECILSAGRLKGLRRIAGAAGEPIKLVGVAVGLPARFTHVGLEPQPAAGP
jgi:Dyp-type peroxidase family